MIVISAESLLCKHIVLCGSAEFNTLLGMDLNMNNNFQNSVGIDSAEQKRLDDRKKEADIRREKINEKIKKESELREEIIKKAREYMVEFEEKRQEMIAKRRKELETKNSEVNNNQTGSK